MATTTYHTQSIPNKQLGNFGTNRSVDPWIVSSKTGEKVVDWRKKIKSGLNASSPYSADQFRILKWKPADFTFKRVRIKPVTQYVPYPPYNLLVGWRKEPDGSYWRKGFYWNYGTTQTNFATFPHVSSVSTEVDNRAIARLHKRIREDSYSVNGLLVLGEIRETIGLLRNPFQSARKAVLKYTDLLKTQRILVRQNIKKRRSDTVKSLSYRRANALKDGMAGSWLELQFAIKPAISDSVDIVAGLQRTVDAFEPNQRFTGSAKEPLAFSGNPITKVAETTSLYTFLERDSVTQASVRYVAIYKRDVRGSLDYIKRTAFNLGFNIENFVPTVWELVPWSFLIDYFVNIGSILECATTSQLNLVTCVRTVKQSTQFNIFERYEGYNEGLFDNARRAELLRGETDSVRVFNRTTVNRTVSQWLPVPSLEFSVPGYGSTKWANMAALLANMKDISRFKRG